MKLSLKATMRSYQDELYIAQTLGAPFESASGTTQDEAKERLTEQVTSALARLHPNRLWALELDQTARTEVRSLPLFESWAQDWSSDGEPETSRDDARISTPVIVLQRKGGLTDVFVPLFNASSHASDNSEESIEQALNDLVTDVRSRTRQTHLHRPCPTSFELFDFTVDFSPLDLSSIDPDLWWADSFDESLLTPEAADEIPTPTLEEVAESWTDLSVDQARSRGFHPVVGRQSTLNEIQELLSGTAPSPVVLVGPTRVGKTALIKHVVWTHVTGELSQRIWFASASRLTSADPMVGWQAQCRDIIKELSQTEDILYMGRLVEALDAGKYFGSNYNLAQFLKGSLADRHIRVVAEATVDQWNEIERRDIGFARTFTVVRIEDPLDPEAQKMVVDACQARAKRYAIAVPEDAILRAWMLHKRFSVDGSPLGRTIDFVNRALRNAQNSYISEINSNAMVSAFCENTGLPDAMLRDDVRLDIERVKSALSRRVIGQEHAITRVADVIGITKAGLASEDRPLGSFLFVGPTGVGKTELAKALSEFLFGTQDRLVRLDMSEYSHGDAYGRLLGEGSQAGELTAPVRRQPFSVVLLDELEKAHPSVFDLLLQVLGEARLTDARGRTTRFQNTIIVMTSNLGVDSLRPSIGFQSSDGADDYSTHFFKEAERFFRPEFLARIDQFVAFKPLAPKVVEKIAARELEKLTNREGFVAQDVSLTYDSDVVAWIARKGWNEVYGARPLKRAIEQEIVAPAGKALAKAVTKDDNSRSRTVALEVDGHGEDKSLLIRIEDVAWQSAQVSARAALLNQIEEISTLRRRLQRYTFTNVYADLEWEVSTFDLSSQSNAFWEDPNAAFLATRAEHARKVIQPAQDVLSELSALEDLATEAYHARSFMLSNDLQERVNELQGRIDELTLTILRAAYETPDRAALFLVSRSGIDPWRDTLVQWYRLRAERRGWELTIWCTLPDFDPEDAPEDTNFDADRNHWRECDEPQGRLVALEFKGWAARALSRGETGIQRFAASEGNGSIEVLELGEYDVWPLPHHLVDGSPFSRVTRTYNFKTGELAVQGHDPVKLDVDDPWSELEPVLEEVAWQITEAEWD